MNFTAIQPKLCGRLYRPFLSPGSTKTLQPNHPKRP